MIRLIRWSAVWALVFGCALSGSAQETARGTVFHDRNGNGVLDAGEPGIPGVAVSNERDVVRTDAQGRYSLPVSGETVIFVIKPAGWQVPIETPSYLPRHYYVHRPDGSPELRYPGVTPTGPLPSAIDFPLTPQEENESFAILCLGDTQPRDQREIDYFAHHLLPELAEADTVMGVTLGDLVFDNLAIYDSLTNALGLLKRPWYHVIGNHDLNFDTPSHELSRETYVRVFGPSYYAFQYAKVHFIAINDIFWDVPNRRYFGLIGEDQLAFIRNYLSGVPKDHLIVPMMHIPLNSVEDRAALFEILAEFPNTMSLSAHWHRQEHFFMGPDMDWHAGEPHHHVVHGTACGSWWTGGFDDLGIPTTTQSDGVPLGYSIIRFDGADYEMTWKVARRPADYQMNIHTPDAVSRGDAGATPIFVNVFAGSERSKVEMRFGEAGEWSSLEQTRMQDPYYLAKSERDWGLLAKIAEVRGDAEITEEVLRELSNEFRPFLGRPQPRPAETGHIWSGTLPANPSPGYHFIYVRTTDMFGQSYTARRAIRIVE
jgi:hypothetical protein